jgi:four helix bundle protein
MIVRRVDDLNVYQKSLDACAAVSAMLKRHSRGNDFDLQTQLKSAAAAVPANIAEGFGQQSDRQFARYLFIARGSSYEIRTHLVVATSRNFLNEAERKELTRRYEEIAKMLTGLIKHLRRSDRRDRG